MEPKDQLNDILWHGLQADIFAAEESLALVREIGVHADAINKAMYGFGHLFGRLQQSSTEIAILAVNRIYDQPKGYPLRSIRSAIQLLEKYSSTLKLIYRSDVESRLLKFGHSETTIRNLSDAKLTELLANEYKTNLPAPVCGDPSGLDALKFRRDKQLAHPEAINAEADPAINYGQIYGLLILPKDFVTVIGRSYLNIVYKFDDGEYFLTKDAEGIVRPLNRLLKRSGIIDGPDRR